MLGMQSSVTKYIHHSYALRYWDRDHKMTCKSTGDGLQQDMFIDPLASLNSHFTDGAHAGRLCSLLSVSLYILYLTAFERSGWMLIGFTGGKNWRVMYIDTMESQGLPSRGMRLSPQAVGSRSEIWKLNKGLWFSTMAADPSLLLTCFFSFWIWKSSKTFAGCLSILSLGTQRASSNYCKSLGPGTLVTRLILLPITIIMPLMFK